MAVSVSVSSIASAARLLIEQRHYGQAFISRTVMLVLCVALAAAGVWLGDSV